MANLDNLDAWFYHQSTMNTWKWLMEEAKSMKCFRIIQFNQHRLKWLNKASPECCVQHRYKTVARRAWYGHDSSSVSCWSQVIFSSSSPAIISNITRIIFSSCYPCISYPISISWWGGCSHQARCISHQVILLCSVWVSYFL